jgi:mRNA-degrading endonuclease YafQ of YafQ-DinJ toxin-antitoxin module
VKRTLIQSAAFTRAIKRYVERQPSALEAIGDALVLLENDAFDPKLKTHKLKGDLAGCWSCSAGYDLRIVFEFVQSAGAEAVLLLSIGTHDEVY